MSGGAGFVCDMITTVRRNEGLRSRNTIYNQPNLRYDRISKKKTPIAYEKANADLLKTIREKLIKFNRALLLKKVILLLLVGTIITLLLTNILN